MDAFSISDRFRQWANANPRLARPLRALKLCLVNLARLLLYPIFLADFLWCYFTLRWFSRGKIPLQAPASGSPKIVMLVWSYLPADPRVEREARALAARGYRVTILCPQTATPAPTPDWGPGVEIKYLPRQTSLSLVMFPWLMSRGVLRAALAEDAWAYHAHDLVMVLPALMAASAKKVPCVCDFHEWYSENVTYDEKVNAYRPHSWLKRSLYRAVESLALRRASRVVTVCDSIATELAAMQRPRASIAVVRNIPPIVTAHDASPEIDIRGTLQITTDKAILLYQGGVGPSRGLEPLIRAMAMVESAVLVIRGPFIEVFEKEYLRLAQEVGAQAKVFCLPAVRSNRCVVEASVADMGFWTLLPLCKNFTYALPNKVFEYLAAGLPVVGAHHPEVAKLLEGSGVGLCFDPESPASIAQAIEALAKNADLRRACRANIGPALRDLQADEEWGKLVAVYRQLTVELEMKREVPTRIAA